MSGVSGGAIGEIIGLICSVKGTVYDVHLLFSSKANEINGVTGNANRERWVVVRMLHGVEQHFAVQNVYVSVIAVRPKERVKNTNQVRDLFFRRPPKSIGHQRGCEGDAVGGVAIRNLRDGCGRCNNTV